MTGKRCIVVLGAPLAVLDAFGRRIAAAHGAGARFIGDLNLAFADNVHELLQLYELSQTPLHEPLYEALAQRLPATEEPRAFLEARRHWSIARLIAGLCGDAPLSIFTDASAGFRIAMLDRWLQALPDALFVHLTQAPQVFCEAARRYYATKLFIPPDYRDHAWNHPAPQLAPELAWYQLNATLARTLAQAPQVRACRIALEQADAVTGAEELDARAQRQRRDGSLDWPFVRAPDLPPLCRMLGYGPPGY